MELPPRIATLPSEDEVANLSRVCPPSHLPTPNAEEPGGFIVTQRVDDRVHSRSKLRPKPAASA